METEAYLNPFCEMTAKQIIDSMFEAKIFAEHVTRDRMNCYEKMLAKILMINGESGELLAQLKAEEAIKAEQKDNILPPL